jgi:hypothetical protein
MTWQPLPLHEERAQELEAIHYLRWATLVRDCGKPIGFGQTFRCRVRCCPSCAEQVAAANSRRAAKAIQKMTMPILVKFKISSLGLRDLDDTLELIRKALPRVQRRTCWGDIRSAVGAYHVKPIMHGKAWDAHVHMVVDAADVDDLDDWEADVERCFREATNGRGRFSLADQFAVDVPLRMARYVFKATRSYAPPPGTLTPRALEVLVKALHKRHLGVHWGSTKRGRRFPRTAPP